MVFGQTNSNDTLGLADGYLSFSTKNWDLKLVKDSQTLASLKPVGSSFDFSPFDVLAQRAANGNYHLGDITFRYRVGGGAWVDGNSASKRSPVTNTSSTGALASSNLSPTLPGLTDLNITREWIDLDGDLGLLFTVTNKYDGTLELGSFGFPIEFNSIFSNRAATDVEANCSLQDPYIGLDAGYVQVTPVDGAGSALVVTALNESKFEAWRFLTEPYEAPLYYQSQTFEGFYEFQVYTLAYAENEWKNVTPWNVPTSRTLANNESITLGLRLSPAAAISDIPSTLTNVDIPFVDSVPGYVIPSDMNATLMLSSTAANFSVDPDILEVTPVTGGYSITPNAGAWGRARLTITYPDGKQQAVHYNVVKSGPTVLSDLGQFLTTSQHYTNQSDPFHRGPSIISYDRSVNNFVTQDNRVWIAGLSDEAGAGSFLAATMKQAAQANAAELAILEQFINKTLWGVIQVNNGSTQYAVRKSVFYYGLAGYDYDPSIDWDGAWDYSEAYSTSRAYDYVHVSAAYWAMYRAARAFPDLLKTSWEWYLNQAYQTVIYCTQQTSSGEWVVGYANDGLMGETVWGEILKDLDRENMTTEASEFEARMKARATYWNSLAVPYGSEMAWDSTGEEGVYYWCNYFGLTATVSKTLSTIQGYMPTVAHWGWNGNARRYWDFLYGGKIERIERQIHHYGSGLNALPLLEQVRNHSTTPLSAVDAHMLRVGYGGNSGPLNNVDQEGFASAAFHSWPDTLEWDPYSGDYGPNLNGMVLGAGCFVVQNTTTQTLVYGGNAASSGAGGGLVVQPRDAVRRRIYFGAWGVQVEIDAGAIEQATFDADAQQVAIDLVSAATATAAQAAQAVVWVTNYRAGGFEVTTAGQKSRGGTLVPFTGGKASFTVAKAA